MAREIPLPTWPNQAEVAVCLTFDVDADAGLLGEGDQFTRRLSALSEARYGVVRGIPRLLELLGDDIPTTFYVPGDTAERYPDAIRAVSDAGHEIAHHGYLHKVSDRIPEDEQRAELEKGIAAIKEVVGYVTKGYRSPAWEVTRETFAMLVELGFDYDSSFMADDRPYFEEYDGKSLLEIPVHWSLDDWPYFGWSPYMGGTLADPDLWRNTCLAEFEAARKDRGILTLTMHPEVIGRPYRVKALSQLVDTLRNTPNVWFAAHRDVAALVMSTEAVSAD